ncbi:hypothetical protein AOQ84DRAFT_281775 [Glonium stellatum]|uniref:NACHT domain-containing protein n=1 Tax=Glonium stellatum TaxID=574774 RepID=A0A8E2FC46_9PEZI|nr:hypothetical protein AOQ84DRAFT_281775 [Glonium stellatum]
MVLDPLSALGLCGNIVQFIDFGAKLISKSTELYKSASGASAENLDLALIADDLRALSESLADPASAISASGRAMNIPPTNNELRIQVLAQKCRELAEQLLDVIESLQVRGPHRRWASFRQALNSVLKKGKLKELDERLQQYRNELSARLIMALQDQNSMILRNLYELIRTSNRFDLRQREALAQLKTDILQTAKQWRSTPPIDHENVLVPKLEKMAAEGSTVAKIQTILDGLGFQSMRVRHGKIPDAFATTFQWAFAERLPESNAQNRLHEWLMSESGIFWISGKPGSGKSTLMKYLSDHPKTAKALHSWAGEKQLVIGAYYFWSAGTELQKTEEGLLRSLLFDIARSTPELIPKAFPNHWNEQGGISLSRQNLHWTNSELSYAMQSFTEEGSGSPKLCLFIDGLDEYDGDPDATISLLKSLSGRPNIKLCISSRPWNQFEEAFGQELGRKLYVHDLTRGDIQIYVHRNLHRNARFAKMCGDAPQYKELEREIVEKAKGVFLWVFLVVRSLLQGLTNADTFRDLERRVERFPGELEPFFKQMLDSVEDVYQEEAASFFLLAWHAVEPLSVFTYSYLGEKDPDFAISMDIAPMDEKDLPDFYDQMRKRLNARCKGLLEFVHEQRSDHICYYKVDFLHRTVRDFFRTQDMAKLLHSRVRPEFEPLHFIYKALLCQLKATPQNTHRLRADNHAGHLIKDLILYVKKCETKPRIELEADLDEMERVYSYLRELAQRFSRNTDYSADSDRIFAYDFLTLAVKSDLVLYVSHKLSLEPHRVKQKLRGRPLLHYALQPSPRPKVVEILLKHGADPNQTWNPRPSSSVDDELMLDEDDIHQSWTTWGLYLHWLNNSYATERGTEKTGSAKVRFDVLLEMLAYGADPYWRNDLYASVVAAIEPVFSPADISIVRDIVSKKGSIWVRLSNWLR